MIYLIAALCSYDCGVFTCAFLLHSAMGYGTVMPFTQVKNDHVNNHVVGVVFVDSHDFYFLFGVVDGDVYDVYFCYVYF